MAFVFKCPNCAMELQAENEWINQQAECPGCHENITISLPEEIADDKPAELSGSNQEPAAAKKLKKTTAPRKKKSSASDSSPTTKTTKKAPRGSKNSAAAKKSRSRKAVKPEADSEKSDISISHFLGALFIIIALAVWIFSSLSDGGCSCRSHRKARRGAGTAAVKAFENDLTSRAMTAVGNYDREYYSISPFNNITAQITDSGEKYVTVDVKTEGTMTIYYSVIFQKQFDGVWKIVSVDRK